MDKPVQSELKVTNQKLDDSPLNWVIYYVLYSSIIIHLKVNIYIIYSGLFRVQLYVQMGGRRGLRVQEQGDGRVERSHGGATVSGRGHTVHCVRVYATVK